MKKQYSVKFDSKLLKGVATGSVIGSAVMGGIIHGAKEFKVGRWREPQSPIIDQPVTGDRPVTGSVAPEEKKKPESKPEPVQRLDLHPETIDFLKKHEGFLPKAKWDFKQYSVGYGTGRHTDGSSVTKDTVVDEKTAHDMLVHHVNQRIVPKVKDLPIWQTMNDRQRGAFTSFLFNVGEHVVGSRNHPTINAAINRNDINGVLDAMSLYNKVTDSKGNKIVSKGLQTRREAERNHAAGQ
jgi:GH24 family phage-related lysozyme (muramidase)